MDYTARSFVPGDMSLGALHHTLLSIIAPRPIAFASTVDAAGNVNLSPFSYFNVFGINPPVCIFSPARSVRTLEHKDTLLNVQEVAEVVINIIDAGIVEQASLASNAYPRGINEFIKAGLTEVASETVRPPRVLEAPASLECRIEQIIPIGDGGGAGNLVVCIVQRIHIQERYLTDEGRVNLEKLELVGRMGGNYYTRAYGQSLFEVIKPNEKRGVGFDALPSQLRESSVLTGGALARLANVEHIPSLSPELRSELISYMRNSYELGVENVAVGSVEAHELVKKVLDTAPQERAIELAWAVVQSYF
jgi:flavin reductase (DIM6/NTAB) family NADH-FMN oxidoreductase RutF